jgi:hypothetical protein
MQRGDPADGLRMTQMGAEREGRPPFDRYRFPVPGCPFPAVSADHNLLWVLPGGGFKRPAGRLWITFGRPFLHPKSRLLGGPIGPGASAKGVSTPKC